jgi:hypothetical protein
VTIDLFSATLRRPARPITVATSFLRIAVTQKPVDHCGGATHAEIAGYRVERAVFRTGAAFKASVFVIDKSLLIFNGNYVARADVNAYAASRAFVVFYTDGGNIVQIFHSNRSWEIL